MKNVYLTAFLTLLTITGFSQTKTIVGIMPFNTTSSGNDNYYNRQNQTQSANIIAIQDAVSDAFLNAKRFTLVEREKMALIKGEKKTQQSDEFIDGSTVEQSKSMGASYIVTGNIQEASFEEKQSELSGLGGFAIPSRKAKISFNIKVIDVSTGQVIKSETIQPKGGSLLGQLSGTAPKSAQGAISKAIQDIESKVDEFVSINFPVSFDIAEINEVDGGGNAKKVLITGGSAFGLKKGDKLIVVEVVEMEVNGKKMNRKKNIGELKIEKIEDENFSICSVKNGGLDINSKFVAKGKLKVITQE